MEEFVGIPSLFISCLEFLLLFNAVAFGQKNNVNIIAFIIIAIYSTNHLFEFFISQFNITEPFFIFLNFILIIFLPALSFLLVLKFWRHETKLQYLIFMPAFVILYYFITRLDSFQVNNFYYFYITFSYPLRNEMGIYYFVMNIAALVILLVKLKEPRLRYKRHLNIILILSSIVCFIIPLILFLFFPSTKTYAESVLNKFAFFYVLGLAYFSLKNKTEFLSEKG